MMAIVADTKTRTNNNYQPLHPKGGVKPDFHYGIPGSSKNAHVLLLWGYPTDAPCLILAQKQAISKTTFGAPAS